MFMDHLPVIRTFKCIDQTISRCTPENTPTWVKTGVSYIATCCLIVLPSAALAAASAKTHPLVTLAATVFAISNAMNLVAHAVFRKEWLNSSTMYLTKCLLPAVVARSIPSAYPMASLAAMIVAVQSGARYFGSLCESHIELGLNTPQHVLLTSSVALLPPLAMAMWMPANSVGSIAAKVTVIAQIATILTQQFEFLVKGGDLYKKGQNNQYLQSTRRLVFLDAMFFALIGLTTCIPTPAVATAGRMALAIGVPVCVQHIVTPYAPVKEEAKG